MACIGHVATVHVAIMRLVSSPTNNSITMECLWMRVTPQHGCYFSRNAPIHILQCAPVFVLSVCWLTSNFWIFQGIGGSFAAVASILSLLSKLRSLYELYVKNIYGNQLHRCHLFCEWSTISQVLDLLFRNSVELLILTYLSVKRTVPAIT